MKFSCRKPATSKLESVSNPHTKRQLGGWERKKQAICTTSGRELRWEWGKESNLLSNTRANSPIGSSQLGRRVRALVTATF
jgi:hypothetical protein